MMVGVIETLQVLSTLALVRTCWADMGPLLPIIGCAATLLATTRSGASRLPCALLSSKDKQREHPRQSLKGHRLTATHTPLRPGS